MPGLGSPARFVVVATIVFGLGVGVTACSQPNQEGGLPPYTGISPNPNDVPPDETDYSVDAGKDLAEFEYEDEPPLADSVLSTLCNLNRTFFSGLRTSDGGGPVADDTLRTNLVGLSDLIDEWESFRGQVPDAVADIDLAEQIYVRWDTALLSMDSGDSRTAQQEMAAAERLLGELPESPREYCSGR